LSDVTLPAITVGLQETAARLTVPEFLHNGVRFARKQQDSPEMRFVIRPTVIASQTGGNSYTLYPRAYF
jgi:hypothetical protein